MSQPLLRSALAVLTAALTPIASHFTAAQNLAAPPGYTLVWSDEFNGAAGTGVNSANWLYDTGTGFGTGEIETMTNSTNSVYQDGQGHLVIKAIRDSSGH